jgi:adenylate cyclase
VTLTEAAERAEVAPATLRSWIRQGLIPQYDGDWTPAAVGQARVVAKVRERGHSLPRIRRATEEGRPGLGGHQQTEDTVSDDELQMLRYVAAVLEAGFPLVAVLQLVRVYGQAIARIADAEVRLFHLYVHEPLMRSRPSGVETAEQMEAMSRQVLPLAGPILDQIHQRYLQFFVEQDVVGHMESDLDGTAVDLGRNHLDFQRIGDVTLKGFSESTEVFVARQRREEAQ